MIWNLFNILLSYFLRFISTDFIAILLTFVILLLSWLLSYLLIWLLIVFFFIYEFLKNKWEKIKKNLLDSIKPCVYSLFLSKTPSFKNHQRIQLPNDLLLVLQFLLWMSLTSRNAELISQDHRSGRVAFQLDIVHYLVHVCRYKESPFWIFSLLLHAFKNLNLLQNL